MTKKTLLRSQAGVRLERLALDLAKTGEDAPRFRLSDAGRGLARMIHDEGEAHRAFARQVAARLQDRPIVPPTAPMAPGF